MVDGNETAGEDAGGVPKPSRSKAPALARLLLAAFLLFFGTYFMVPILPLHLTALGYRNGQIGLIIGVASLFSCMAQPVSGYLADRSNRRRLLLLGGVVTVILPLLYVLSRSLFSFVLVRAIHGVSLGLFYGAAITWIGSLAPTHRKGLILSWFLASVNLAQGVAPAVALKLYMYFCFDHLMPMVSLIGALSVLCAWFLPTCPGLIRKNSQAKGYLHPGQGLGAPIIIPAIVSFSYAFGIGAVTTFLPLFAESWGLHDVSWFFIFFFATVIIARLWGGIFSDRWGRQRVIVPGLILVILGMVALSAAKSYCALVVAALLIGVGHGHCSPALNALVVDRAPERSRGVALGVFGAAFDLGVMSGSMILGIVSEVLGYRAMYLIAAGVSAAGLVLQMISLLFILPLKERKYWP